jgi:arabinogalactan oligomer/maltooligosaccharide transport system permease protein
MAIIVIYPITWIIGSALNPTTGILNPTTGVSTGRGISAIQAIPSEPTLDNFKRLFTTASKNNFWDWYRNTAVVAVLTMIFAVILNTFTAFVFARFRFKGSKAGLLAMMILQMFPSFLSLVAIYVICLNFGMINNIYALVFIYVGGSIPYNIWLVRGYMMNIPKSLDEAAVIDGASKLQIFFRVIFPMSVPIISFMAVTAFMAPWMDYILPRMLLSSNENLTLAIGLFRMADSGDPGNYDITAFSAGCLIVGIPIATLYMVFQRFLLVGLTAGANKGE